MPRAKKGQQKVQIFKKTTGLCPSRCYYFMLYCIHLFPSPRSLRCDICGATWRQLPLHSLADPLRSAAQLEPARWRPSHLSGCGNKWPTSGQGPAAATAGQQRHGLAGLGQPNQATIGAAGSCQPAASSCQQPSCSACCCSGSRQTDQWACSCDRAGGKSADQHMR